jgi:hypothetical protein
VLNQAPCHEDVQASGVTAPRILNSGTRLKWVVNLTLRGNSSRYPFDKAGRAPELVWIWGSWDGIVTRLMGWTTGVRFPAGWTKGIFSSPLCPDPPWGLPASYPVSTEVSFPVGGPKATGSWSWPTLFLIVPGTNGWNYTTSTPYVFAAWYLIKNRMPSWRSAWLRTVSSLLPFTIETGWLGTDCYGGHVDLRRQEVAGSWRKLRNEEFTICTVPVLLLRWSNYRW